MIEIFGYPYADDIGPGVLHLFGHARDVDRVGGLELPGDIPEWISPLLAVLPGQLLAMYLARAKGLDPDHPRGLNKVTQTW